MTRTYILKIYRGQPGRQYWEEFELELKPHANLISSLMEIQRNPVNRQGEHVPPVAYESGCLEEVCGSCSMLVNGKPRQACTALIEPLLAESNVITVAPFTKFPLVRDLMVDRTSMFDNLKKVSAWVDADSSHDAGFGPKISQETQEKMYHLSQCMTCGCCVEACPQVNSQSPFMGPAVIGQVQLFNLHPVAGMQKAKRIEKMMHKGGVSGCGNAQNCVRVCPKKIPLTDAIAAVGRSATIQAIKELFG
ncbi:MAG: succinate dehydrogenase iron-sulfur subunit [Verrucomicrobia bacterium]|nr:succinate dehydrogenase iron-sulfur subunit [Verrucomicrobiota bacterium]MBS0636590.1 succinate dehydrogenase iron-sulfur subunit [Verrucomicrobiota bacterium]